MTRPKPTFPELDWGRIREAIPCPDVIWQGVWNEVGERLGRSWDVWAATYCAMGALAQRNMWWHYYKTPMYGMTYVLVVAPTGTGKEFGVNIVRALLREEEGKYKVRDSVQSGPGLFTVLCDTEARERVKPATPVVLAISEWGKIVHLGGVQHSTLIDDLNAIFHRAAPWNVTRSDREFAGGDRSMGPPTLSIYGTTTPQVLLADVDEEKVNRGFLNRYLILPGPTAEWRFRPRRKLDDPAVALKDITQRVWGELEGFQVGGGRSYEEAFSEELWEVFEPWGERIFGPVMQESGVQANRKKRLHFYTHHIALLSAWTRRSERVDRLDVEMAMAVAEASNRFIDLLWSDDPITLTTMEAGDFQVEGLVFERIKERPDYYDKYKLRESLRKYRIPLTKISKCLEVLVRDGCILLNPESMRYVVREAVFPSKRRAAALALLRSGGQGGQRFGRD
jgi:hypothetical protein